MSRLRPIQIPFTGGLQDQSDPKLQDPSHVQDVVNARLPALGALRLRRGWRPLAMGAMGGDGDGSGGGTSTLVAEDLYSCGDALVIKCHKTTDTHAQRLAYYVASNATRPWRLPARESRLPSATFVRTFGGIPQVPAYTRADCAITYDGVYGAMLVTVPATATTSDQARLHIFRLDTNETVWNFQCASDALPRRLVSAGGTAFAVFNLTAGGALVLTKATPTDASAGLSSVATLFASGIDEFEVAVARETTPTAYHVLTRVGATVSYSQFDLTGTQVGSSVDITTNADSPSGNARMAIASDDSQVWVAVRDNTTHTYSLTTLDAASPFSTLVGPTELFSGATVASINAACSLSYSSSSVYAAATSTAGHISTYVDVRARSDHSLTYSTTHSAQRLCSAWVVKEEVGAIGCAAFDHSTVDPPNGLTYAPCGWNSYIDSSSSASSGPWWAGDYDQVGFSNNVDLDLSYVGQGPVTTALCVMPVVVGALIQPMVRAFEVADTGRRQGCELNGVLYIAGGVMTQFSAGAIDGVENGILAPLSGLTTKGLTAVGSGGDVEAGTYGYRAIVTWTDALQRTHRSAVGSQLTGTASVDGSSFVTSWAVPKTLRRDENGFAPPIVELYRTEKGLTDTSTGEIFRLVGSAPVDDTGSDLVAITDTVADADLLGRAVLYTEGDIGAVSGVLDIAPPTPHAYVAPLRDRLVVGFTDIGSGYQVSQTALPNEPVAFTQPGISGTPALAYQDTVEGRVTAVAGLDDVIIVGTSAHIYYSSGDGPNLAGQGEFSSPARYPADIGIYDWRSVLENSEGLYFLGASTDLYRLPRGGGAPVRVQDPRSIWALGTVVGAGTAVQDNVSVWGVDTGSAGIAAVRDIAKQLWLRDALPFRPIAFRAHQGVLYAIDTAGTVWQQSESAYGDGASGATAVALQVVTGDIVAVSGGLAGFGRVGAIEVLGEYRADAAVRVEASYDSGATFTDLGTFTVSGLSAGTMFQRQWFPSQQRTSKLRLRITMTPSVSTTEGCRLTGCVVYLSQSTGPSRLDSTRRT